jgi:hypothetical protein
MNWLSAAPLSDGLKLENDNHRDDSRWQANPSKRTIAQVLSAAPIAMTPIRPTWARDVAAELADRRFDEVRPDRPSTRDL